MLIKFPDIFDISEGKHYVLSLNVPKAREKTLGSRKQASKIKQSKLLEKCGHSSYFTRGHFGLE